MTGRLRTACCVIAGQGAHGVSRGSPAGYGTVNRHDRRASRSGSIAEGRVCKRGRGRRLAPAGCGRRRPPIAPPPRSSAHLSGRSRLTRTLPTDISAAGALSMLWVLTASSALGLMTCSEISQAATPPKPKPPMPPRIIEKNDGQKTTPVPPCHCAAYQNYPDKPSSIKPIVMANARLNPPSIGGNQCERRPLPTKLSKETAHIAPAAMPKPATMAGASRR